MEFPVSNMLKENKTAPSNS